MFSNLSIETLDETDSRAYLNLVNLYKDNVKVAIEDSKSLIIKCKEKMYAMLDGDAKLELQHDENLLTIEGAIFRIIAIFQEKRASLIAAIHGITYTLDQKTKKLAKDRERMTELTNLVEHMEVENKNKKQNLEFQLQAVHCRYSNLQHSIFENFYKGFAADIKNMEKVGRFYELSAAQQDLRADYFAGKDWLST